MTLIFAFFCFYSICVVLYSPCSLSLPLLDNIIDPVYPQMMPPKTIPTKQEGPSDATAIATATAAAITTAVTVDVTFQATPNPASMKFLFEAPQGQYPSPFQNLQFNSAIESQISPLASKIFGFPWTHSILLGKDFITVNKENWVEWDVLAQPLADLIAEHLNKNLPLLLTEEEIKSLQRGKQGPGPQGENLQGAAETTSSPTPRGPGSIQEVDPDTLSHIAKKIKAFLDEKVRPAVAMDGGDVVFHKYEKNIVYIYMQGACVGCPSSTMTLKGGIETHLKELFPEVKEVVALNN